jgi:hypothetical protein
MAGGGAERIARRVARALGNEQLLEALVALPASELTSLLLEVFRRRSRARTPAELLAQYQRGDALAPSNVDPRELLPIEAHCYASAPAFEPITLPPVSPVGLNQVLGDIDQNSTLAALRNLELLADPTTMMALETTQRRARGGADARFLAGGASTIVDEVHLCTWARLMRMQPFDTPGFSRHFAIFALTSGGRDRGSFAFELAALAAHARVHLTLLARLAAEGFHTAEVRFEVSDTAGSADSGARRRLAAVENELFPTLVRDFPAVTCALDPARTHAMSYYRGLCFHVAARARDGAWLPIADGGSTDWTQRLRSDAKERLLVSGIGAELLPRRYR